MRDDHLARAALNRLQELGLPPYLIELGEFRDDFFYHGWVLLVRDQGNITHVDLFHPEEGKPSLRRRR